MTKKSTTLQNKFIELLKKSSRFTKRKIKALWHIIRSLIGTSSFSLKKIIKRIKSKFSRNFLALVLKEFAYVQETVFLQLFEEITKLISLKDKISIILDDTLVKKRGKHIFGSLNWYDHAKGRLTRSICLVNLGIVINGELVLVLPYLLRIDDLEKSKTQSKTLSQDPKTIAGMELIFLCNSYLETFSISKKQVLILVDSWYCTKTFKQFLNKLGLNYRMDSRYNLNVQQPDHVAITKRNIPRRGRKRKYWRKYTKLSEYFKSSRKVWYFKNKKDGLSIQAKRANLTLKAHGRVLIYAFHSPQYEEPKFIMIKSQTRRPPAPKTVYHEYLVRWEIEQAHRELKQQFGLGKSQNRDPWVVMGFIGLVNFGYSIYKFLNSTLDGKPKISLKCPTWAEEFHKEQIVIDYLSLS